MEISVKGEFKNLEKLLGGLEKQTPFILAATLTKTAQQVQHFGRVAANNVFDYRNSATKSYTEKSIKITPAKKTDAQAGKAEAVVYAGDPFLSKQAEGGRFSATEWLIEHLGRFLKPGQQEKRRLIMVPQTAEAEKVRNPGKWLSNLKKRVFVAPMKNGKGYVVLKRTGRRARKSNVGRGAGGQFESIGKRATSSEQNVVQMVLTEKVNVPKRWSLKAIAESRVPDIVRRSFREVYDKVRAEIK